MTFYVPFYFFYAVPAGQKHAKARPCDGGPSACLSSSTFEERTSAKVSYGVGLRLREWRKRKIGEQTRETKQNRAYQNRRGKGILRRRDVPFIETDGRGEPPSWRQQLQVPQSGRRNKHPSWYSLSLSLHLPVLSHQQRKLSLPPCPPLPIQTCSSPHHDLLWKEKDQVHPAINVQSYCEKDYQGNRQLLQEASIHLLRAIFKVLKAVLDIHFLTKSCLS